MSPKKNPQRMCVGCREMKDKRDLTRVVRSPEGQVSLDETGKKNGRGAYLCPALACLEKARKARSLERAFAMKIPGGLYESLAAALENRPKSEGNG